MATVYWPYYCTIQDVRDKLVLMTIGSTVQKLTNNVALSLISQVHGRVNGALGKGGYSVPAYNADATTTTGALTASDNVVTIGVSDVTIFSLADSSWERIAFVHGQNGSMFNAEFLHVVDVDATASTVAAFSLLNAYDSGATVERVDPGFNFLRECTAAGAAAEFIGSLRASGGLTRSEEGERLESWHRRCLESLAKGEVSLTGLTSMGGAIESYHTENSGDSDVDPIYEVDMEF